MDVEVVSKHWARADFVVMKVGGMPPEDPGALDVHSSGRSSRISTGVDRWTIKTCVHP